MRLSGTSRAIGGSTVGGFPDDFGRNESEGEPTNRRSMTLVCGVQLPGERDPEAGFDEFGLRCDW